MTEVNPVFLAALSGFVCALIFASIPVGPINLTILNEGTCRGFRWAFFIGLGASVMDAIYCAISFTGLSQFFSQGTVKLAMQIMSFFFLLFLGFKFLFAKTVKVHTKLEAASEKLEARIEQRIQPHSAFATGFVRVLANLGVLVAWVVLSASLMSSKAFFTDQEWVADCFSAKTACVTAVFTGTVLWFLFLSFVVSRGHGKFSERTLLRFQHLSGLCLLFTAVFEGGQITWHLAKNSI